MTVGHGSPNVVSWKSPFARFQRIRLGAVAHVEIAGARFLIGRVAFAIVLGWLLIASQNAALAQSKVEAAATNKTADSPVSIEEAKLALELRIVWGGGTARPFQGNISIENGGLRLVRNLSLQADSIGSITPSSRSALDIAGHSVSTFGGVDVMIEGTASSRLTIRFDHPTTNQPIEQSFAIRDILQESWMRKIDDQGNRIAAERQMQDRLRVHCGQAKSIFQVGTTWRGTLSGYHCGLQPGDYQLTTKLVDQARGDATVSEQEQTIVMDAKGNFNSPSIEVELPRLESAYAIEFTLHRKRFLQSFVSATHPLKRRVDLIAFDYSAPPTHIENWAPVASIQPLNSQWWKAISWLTTLGSTQPLVQLPAFSEHTRRLVSHGQQASRTIGEEDCLTLGPGAWQAYPLTIEHPGQPHRLRVRLPSDRAQQLIVSIRDFYASGEPTTLNVDSGVVLGERQLANLAVGAGAWVEHEVVFWPRSPQPYLLMMNASSTQEAGFGELQLEVGQIQPVTAPVKLKSTDGSEDPRMVALYLTKPLMADAFGAQRNLDPVTHRPLESWLTWQQSASRLTQYMQNAGYNSLILNVAGDGGSVLPLPRLDMTTRFDNGTFYSDGRSAEIKDFVELLCCHFDRCGLKLILAMDLNNHLPSLARLETNEAKREGLFQVNLEGKPWQFDSEVSNRRVLYNPLHPQVQTELEQIVREVSQQYAPHRCFSGVALELGEASHLVFAGDRWGYDETTFKQFEAATQSKLPARDVLPIAMQGALRLSYLNWRARALSTFYVRLADTLQTAKPDAKLLLNPLALWQQPPTQHRFVDPVASSRNLADTMLAAGIDAAWLKQHQQVALLRGQLDCPLGSGLEQDWLSRAASDPGLTHASAGNSSGTLDLQRPVGILIPEASKLLGSQLQAAANTNAASNAAWCYPIAAGLGPGTRKIAIEQLYREDSLLVADGGWMPQQRDSTQLSYFRRALLELPNVPMSAVKVDGDDTNFRVRSIKVGSNTYLQLINNSSWTERVTMDVKIAAIRGMFDVLGGKELQINGAAAAMYSSSSLGAQGGSANAIWQFDLPPYDLVALKISDPQFKLNNLMHSADPSVVDEKKREIESLESTLGQISDSARAESLSVPGGDFEQWVAGGRPNGWTISSLPQVTISREEALPHSGASCVAIENRNQARVSAWMQSEPIRIPESGRLVVNAWVRTPSAANQPLAMRLSLIGRLRDGRRYQRSHQFGTQPGGGDIAGDWGKRPVTLFATDVPSADLVELHVAFDLVGPGKVWVDDIQAFEAYLNPDERVQIRGQIFLAKEKLRENNAFPAEQVLNSHLARYLATLSPPPANQTEIRPQPSETLDQPANGNRWNNTPPVLQQLRESMRERWQR